MNETERLSRPSPMVEAVLRAYRRGQEDEALEPMVARDAVGRPWGRFSDGDYVIFYDLRGEREVELTQSLTETGFSCFPVRKDLRLHFVTMIEYSSSLEVKVAFPPLGEVRNGLVETVCGAGHRVLKIAESEKAVHIGFFLNGKREEPFPGEERIIVPSPEGVADYALTPGMSAQEVVEKVRAAVDDPSFALIVANLANVDVVGHVENRGAVLEAVRAVDNALGQIHRACEEAGRTLVVTSDHGTVEEWLYPDGVVNTGHSRNPVPLLLADFRSESWSLRSRGELADVAPTVLELLGIRKPSEMTGRSLLQGGPDREETRRRLLLLILDGWGMREELMGNLIREARPENFFRLWSRYPRALLQASGEAVGMPPGTVGNSEAGHLHIGAGRRIFLDRVRIDRAISDGSFERNPAFLWAMEGACRDGKALHLLGIVSHYSSHGTIDHLYALLRMAKKKGLRRVYVHALIGRRGEKPESGAVYVGKVEEMCRNLSLGRVVTVMGRFWALDREANWDRVEKAYRALVFGEGTGVEMERFPEDVPLEGQRDPE